MAELGVAVSVISIASIAIQIGDSLIKLKSFWDHVKEAPSEIRWLIEEIETLNIALSEIEPSKAQNGLPPLEPAFSTRCLELCRKGASILEVVVKEADEEIQKGKKVGSIKVMLKKGKMEVLKERLRNAQLMLILSNQTYSEALQRQRHELQRQWTELQEQQIGELRVCVSQSTEAILSLQRAAGDQRTPPASTSSISTRTSHSAAELQSLEHAAVRIKTAQTRQRAFMTKFRGPRWFSLISRAFEISGKKSPYGWDFSIRTYNIVPDLAPVMDFARKGELSKLRDLITEGKASLSDYSEHGETPFSAALQFGRLEIVRFLITQDAAYTKFAEPVLEAVQPYHYTYNDKTGVELIKLIAPMLDFDEWTNGRKLDTLTWGYIWDSRLFTWTLRQLGCSFRSLHLRERVTYSTRLLIGKFWAHQQPDAVDLLRTTFEDMKLDADACKMTDRRGLSLLHAMAFNVSAAIDGRLEKLQKMDKERTDQDDLRSRCFRLMSVLDEIIQNNPSLHGLGLRPSTFFLPSRLNTPLMMVFSGYINSAFYQFKHPDFRIAGTAAMVWLRQLRSSGIDLVEYGRREKHVHIHNRISKEYVARENDDAQVFRFISFDYGPEPADWQFYFTEAMKNYFMQFWDMIDHPERALPGAWIDDPPWDDKDPWGDLSFYDIEFDTPLTAEECNVVGWDHVDGSDG